MRKSNRAALPHAERRFDLIARMPYVRSLKFNYDIDDTGHSDDVVCLQNLIAPFVAMIIVNFPHVLATWVVECRSDTMLLDKYSACIADFNTFFSPNASRLARRLRYGHIRASKESQIGFQSRLKRCQGIRH